MRLRSDLWVSAYLRRCAVQGVVAVLRRRGAAEAGAIFVKLDRLDGTATLYGPAPPTEDMPQGVDRLFARMHATEAVTPADVEARLARQRNFDPDIWVVEVEDRGGRPFLDLAPA
ncbi:hypothetical protein SAMN05444161_5806 [Rhizobiales bacterium GAS191]|jgi:hypothetical protein|nr:hypothetical protein SAMN05519103_04999 [Rhizobiales bacterium GAS113]SEE11527.1 hypothetical protein SAMN05519104_5242 [Rhizobiales bacterium GAS188]SEE45185.1 hypothetical protein SAMN05444161_5806 [Rhizobiales bacterium GAS191]